MDAGKQDSCSLYEPRTRWRLAEISFHLAQQTPLPSKPVSLHKLRVATDKTLRLARTDLDRLGVDPAKFGEFGYRRTQEIGAIVAFLEYDGLIAPSARWDCDNLMLFNDSYSGREELEILESETLDWREWARANGFISAAGMVE